MLARLHVVIASEDERQIKHVCDLLKTIDSRFSISPSRPYQGLKDHSEVFCTLNIEKKEVPVLLEKLNNDWDGEEDDCVCYGFNTIMFDKSVYCLEFVLFD